MYFWNTKKLMGWHKKVWRSRKKQPKIIRIPRCFWALEWVRPLSYYTFWMGYNLELMPRPCVFFLHPSILLPAPHQNCELTKLTWEVLRTQAQCLLLIFHFRCHYSPLLYYYCFYHHNLLL